MRWITSYIDENTERWDTERKERQDKESQWITEWTVKTKQEKILDIRTNQAEHKNISKVPNSSIETIAEQKWKWKMHKTELDNKARQTMYKTKLNN